MLHRLVVLTAIPLRIAFGGAVSAGAPWFALLLSLQPLDYFSVGALAYHEGIGEG